MSLFLGKEVESNLNLVYYSHLKTWSVCRLIWSGSSISIQLRVG
jgi:hypothetical protein